MIRTASPEELEKVLALQKRAFRSEAVRYDDFNMPPITQSLDEISAESLKYLILVYETQGDILGSVRGFIDEQNQAHIGRLVVEPGQQRGGIGTQLMEAIEKEFQKASRFLIFTGAQSEGTIRLYERLGYEKTHLTSAGHYELIHMHKLNPA